MSIASGASESPGGPPELAALLDPADVQRALKLSSRRGARELIVREMEHVVVGRTPMTTSAWLAEWLERQRRAPRRRAAGPARQVTTVDAVRAGRGLRSGPAMPAARRRVKGA